jgi:hypothetical protein
MYASLLGICPQKTRTPHPSGGSPVSDALHLDVFDQPVQQVFLSNLAKDDHESTALLHRGAEINSENFVATFWAI